MIYISCVVMICSIIIVLVYRHQTVKTFESLNNMIDGIIENVFVYERQPAKISREQADLLGYILYSDTMIEKAKRERLRS